MMIASTSISKDAQYVSLPRETDVVGESLRAAFADPIMPPEWTELLHRIDRATKRH